MDTHVWIWAAQKPANLDAKARRQLESARNELYLSPVSIWEAALLARRKKFPMKGTFADWFSEVSQRVALREAPLTFSVAAETSWLHLPHADPGDTLIVATAAALDLTLVTADRKLLALRWLKTLPAV